MITMLPFYDVIKGSKTVAIVGSSFPARLFNPSMLLKTLTSTVWASLDLGPGSRGEPQTTTELLPGQT